MFPEVIVPEEVREELLAKDSPDRTQLAQILEQASIHPRQLQPDRLLLAELDEGEAAVIATALQLGFPSVLLDERKARRVANRVMGSKSRELRDFWLRQKTAA
jgi:predicted nucleic acid-binding protein